MQDFAELHLKPETLAQYGLPDIAYPVPATDLKSALLDNGDLPLAVMLHGLQVALHLSIPLTYGVRTFVDWLSAKEQNTEETGQSS